MKSCNSPFIKRKRNYFLFHQVMVLWWSTYSAPFLSWTQSHGSSHDWWGRFRNKWREEGFISLQLLQQGHFRKDSHQMHKMCRLWSVCGVLLCRCWGHSTQEQPSLQSHGLHNYLDLIHRFFMIFYCWIVC